MAYIAPISCCPIPLTLKICSVIIAPPKIAGRFKAIARALEMRAISVAQHSSERSMILDALMPSAPVVIANAAIPPRGLMQAADAVRRLEKLKNNGYINNEEYRRERQAVEIAMRPPAPRRPVSKKNSETNTSGKPAKKLRSPQNPQPGVHLASYRTSNQATRGWSQIKRAHRKLVGALEHMVKRVNLGKKGTYYRLIVGPLPSMAAAKSMCRKLKRRRQFCEPSTMVSG